MQREHITLRLHPDIVKAIDMVAKRIESSQAYVVEMCCAEVLKDDLPRNFIPGKITVEHPDD